MADDLTPRTECIECGSELWGPLEKNGLCVRCRQTEQDELADDGPDFYDNDEDLDET